MPDGNIIPACKIHVDEVAGLCEMEIYDATSGKPIENIQKVVFEKAYDGLPKLHIDFVQKITKTKEA